jgi:transposase-like protein
VKVKYSQKGADVSQSENVKANVAEARTEETRSFVRTVKGATRCKYPPEEKIRIVLEGFRREVTVNDLCRREGIKPHSYYAWTKECMEAGKARLTRDTVRDATQQEIAQPKRAHGELKQLVADLSLQVHRLKKTAIPMLNDAVGTRG